MYKLLVLVAGTIAITVSAIGQTPRFGGDRTQRAEEALQARLKYAASAKYNPYDSDIHDAKEKCWQLVDKSEFKSALAEAETALKKDPYNIDIIIAQAAALRALGETAAADQVRSDWTALVDSIVSHGDGKSYSTAYRVISVDEEYTVMHVLHLDVKQQRLVTHEHSQYDVFAVHDPRAGKDFDLYFNIDLPKGWLDQTFSKRRNATQPAKPDSPTAASGKNAP